MKNPGRWALLVALMTVLSSLALASHGLAEVDPGDIVHIPPNVKHWHGAAKDSAFQHLAVEVPAEGGSTEWCEAVDENAYNQLP